MKADDHLVNAEESQAKPDALVWQTVLRERRLGARGEYWALRYVARQSRSLHIPIRTPL
jgi:hypothetical protein